MSAQACCEHCGKKAAQRNLRENPSGGARCKDWFACQQRRDAAKKSRGRCRLATS